MTLHAVVVLGGDNDILDGGDFASKRLNIDRREGR